MAIVRGDRISDSRRLNEGSVEAMNFFAALLWKAVSPSGLLPRTTAEIELKLYGRASTRFARTMRLLGELRALGVIVEDGGRLRVLNHRFWVSHERTAIPVEVRRRVLERDGNCCRACLSRDDLQLDHVIAVTNGGSDDEANLQTLCGACNRAKGAL